MGARPSRSLPSASRRWPFGAWTSHQNDPGWALDLVGGVPTGAGETPAFAENVNYEVRSSFLLSFLECVPEVSAKLTEANTKERKFEDVVLGVEQAAVLVLVY